METSWRSLLETADGEAGIPLALGVELRQRTPYRPDEVALLKRLTSAHRKAA